MSTDDYLMTIKNTHYLENEVLEDAHPCSVCHGMIPLGMTALVYRKEGSIEACVCSHLYCRTRLREEFLILSEDCGEYVN
jgi:hypothetical protein